MRTLFILTLLVVVIFAVTSCTGKSKQPKEESLWNGTKTEVMEQEKSDLESTVDSDTTIYEMPPVTATLKNAIEYFRQNNKYKDWDKNDKRKVFVRGVVEKDGRLSHIEKIGGDGNEELREETIRLLKEAKISPAEDGRGNSVRSYWTILVEFPPK